MGILKELIIKFDEYNILTMDLRQKLRKAKVKKSYKLSQRFTHKF